MFRLFILIFISLFVHADKHTYASSYSEKLGSVNFSTSALAPAQEQFLHGVAALHSF
jgi:hypothetical protein